MPSLGFDCMGQIIHNKQNMSHQTAPEYDGIPQQVDPVVVPREYLPLKRFYQTLVLLNLKYRCHILNVHFIRVHQYMFLCKNTGEVLMLVFYIVPVYTLTLKSIGHCQGLDVISPSLGFRPLFPCKQKLSLII